MKKLLLIVLPLLLIVGCSKNLDIELLKDRNGVKYEQNSKKPFTGRGFILYQNGQTFLDGSYKNGLASGEWTVYYQNGNKARDLNFKEGKLEGQVNRYSEKGKKTISLLDP